MNIISIQQEIENDIKKALETMPHRRHGVRHDAANRRHVVFVLRNAVANVIAEDILHDETPMERTVNKYGILLKMDETPE